MATCFHRFLRDESGLVITAELIMIITIAVISLTAGWGAVAAMLAEELEDVANSVGSLDQSFSYNGISAPGHATCSGGGFRDSRNFVNVSTTSNLDASVAGFSVTPVIPEFQASSLGVETAVEAQQFVLVEEDFGINVQIDDVLLLELIELEIVKVRQDGSVVLLREDLIEIQEDSSVVILYDLINRQTVREKFELQHRQPQTNTDLDDLAGCRKELEALKRQLETQATGASEELRRENARLRELIEKHGRKLRSR